MFELQNARYQTVAYGNRQHVNHAVKNEMQDGRYRIVGPGLQLYCIRINGKVYPDPESVPLDRYAQPKVSAMQYFM